MSKEFKMGFIEEVEPLKLTTIPKKYQKLIEATENRWFNKMQKLAKICQKRIDDLEHRLSNCIEPKFKVGQEVWVVDNLAEEIYAGQIMFIEAQKYKEEKESIIWYQVEYFDECTMSGPFEEQFTFATEEEAKAKLEGLKNG